MFFALFCLSTQFQVKGRWNVSVTGNRIEDTNFKLIIKKKEGKLVGRTISSKKHDFIPKKLHIKELEEDSRYVLILPYYSEPKFADFKFTKQNNVLTSNVNSTDKKWNVTATVIPSQSITLSIRNNHKKQWLTYTATLMEPGSGSKNLPFILMMIVLFPIIAYSSFRFFTSFRKPVAQKQKGN